MDRTVFTSFSDATAFLYTGSNAIQTGVTPGALQPERVAVVRGRILQPDGMPLPGVAIKILNHSEFGSTLSRLDGYYDLAVNGGGILILAYEKEGFLPAQRQTDVPWQDYTVLPDVIMMPLDTNATTVELNMTAPMQIARGTVVMDTAGTRQATVLFPAGTTAVLEFADGSTQAIGVLTVRATEYTVGTNGPQAMPALLPPNSAYTYCVELSADEAILAGASTVRLNRPIYNYVENFLGFPVGSPVPSGYYDRNRGQWIPSDNGRVVAILSVNGGKAELDIDGSGNAADEAALAALGVTPDERVALATLYAPGTTLWRVPITHFTPCDYNWPFGPPPDAKPPMQPEPRTDEPAKDPCLERGSIIELQNQILRKDIPIVGTPFGLHYSSDRVPGRTASQTLQIQLSGATVPASLKRIELRVTIAGKEHKETFPPATNLSTIFTWDGKDVYGRLVQGKQCARVEIGYVYDGIYQEPAASQQSFAAFSGVPIPGNVPAREITLWQKSRGDLQFIGQWDSRAQGFGGWSISPHHVYDPNGRVLYYGTGERLSANNQNLIARYVAGNLPLSEDVPDGESALRARLDQPWLAAGPDGSVYVTDRHIQRWDFKARVRRIRPDGTIVTVAGGGFDYPGDGGPATNAMLFGPSDVAVAPDGTLYIADQYDHRIRKVDPQGIITTVAGDGTADFGGDGGPAILAQLNCPATVVLGPDGSLYIGDYENHRVRRVDPNGIITTVAGNGSFGFSGDGGPASQASLARPLVAVAPDGSIYVSTCNRVRRIGNDGIISTIAGGGQQYAYESGIAATDAGLGWVDKVAFGPDGSFYVPDVWEALILRVNPEGILSIVAGENAYNYGDDLWPANQIYLYNLRCITVGAAGEIYFSQGSSSYPGVVRQLEKPFPRALRTDIVVASEDGTQLYHFTPTGRHLRTLDAVTGNVIYEFGYDAAGLLVTITDIDGDVTRIERDANGLATAIVSPDGHRTTLGYDANGWLNRVSSPANETLAMSYTPDGLLTGFTNPRQQTSTLTCDALGRLQADTDPAGGFTYITRTELADGFEIMSTSAMNYLPSRYLMRKLASGVEYRENIGPDGSTNRVWIGSDDVTTTQYADGTVSVSQKGPDPRWGMQAPITARMTVTLPNGNRMTITTKRAVRLADSTSILTLTNQTDTITVNNLTFTSTYSFDGVNRVITATSPLGRTSVSILDDKGRIIESAVPGIAPVNYQYL